MLSACLLLLLSLPTTRYLNAAPRTYNLAVSVNIDPGTPAGDLEIVTFRNDFTLTYDAGSQSFIPISIPFTVRSTTLTSASYNLLLVQLGGHCDGETPFSPTSELDSSPVGVGVGVGYTGVEKDHLLKLSFPVVPQTSVDVICQGTARVVAELSL